MWRYIEQIRKKPKPVRNMYAFWGAAFFTAVVVAVWSMSLPNRILSVLSPVDESSEASGRLWSGVVEYGSGLRANLMDVLNGQTEEKDSATTTPAQGEYAIDLSDLNQATSTETKKAGVWQNTYQPRSGGKVIQIGTTSSSVVDEETQ